MRRKWLISRLTCGFLKISAHLYYFFQFVAGLEVVKILWNALYIQTTASSIFSFSHVSVINIILTQYWSHRIIFKSSIFDKHDFLFERRKVSELVCVLKFENEFIKGILIKLLLIYQAHLIDNLWNTLVSMSVLLKEI